MEETKKALFLELETDSAGVLLPFKTEKHKYNIIRPGEPMGISRWTAFRKQSIITGTGKTFPEIANAFEEIEIMAVKNEPYDKLKRDIVLLANSNRRGIIEMSKAKHDYLFYQASLFIVREGDELKDWSYDLANDYIDDWQKNRLSEQPFFFFAAKTVNGLREQSKKLKEEVERQTGILMDTSGYTKMVDTN